MNRSCLERWSDEVGCEPPDEEHQCTVMEEQRHRTHLCHCGATVIEDGITWPLVGGDAA